MHYAYGMSAIVKSGSTALSAEVLSKVLILLLGPVRSALSLQSDFLPTVQTKSTDTIKEHKNDVSEASELMIIKLPACMFVYI